MGIDIYPYVECDFQNSVAPFSTVDSVRCINSGHFFVWRCPELFHALGLNYWRLDLPRSPLILGRLPGNLSSNLIQKETLIVSPHVNRKTKSENRHRFPFSEIRKWNKQQLQYFPIDHPSNYGIELDDGEELIFDPGCELPNFASAKEIRDAIDFCNIGNLTNVEYFLAIVELMDKIGETLSPNHVRLIYWFDSLGGDFMREYRAEHGVDSRWPAGK